METTFSADELEQTLLNDSMVGASMIMFHPQPATVKAPMSKFAIEMVSVTIDEPVSETSPAEMSVKVPGCMRCMVMSPAVMVSNTASELDGPLPV